MNETLTILQNFSPIGVIALLILVIWQIIKNSDLIRGTRDNDKIISSKNVVDFDYLKNQLDLLGNNHLSGLPELIETSKRLEAKSDKMIDLLTRIDAKMK